MTQADMYQRYLDQQAHIATIAGVAALAVIGAAVLVAAILIWRRRARILGTADAMVVTAGAHALRLGRSTGATAGHYARRITEAADRSK